MPNPGQPTIRLGANGNVVRRLQRALRRTPNPGLKVDGIFGPGLETVVKDFQEGAGLVVDGIVGPLTWNALPGGGPMPVLREGSSGEVVRALQTLLTNGASGAWTTTPQGIDGNFGPHYQGFRAGLSDLGWRCLGRSGWRPDLGSLAACRERHLGECGWPQVRSRLNWSFTLLDLNVGTKGFRANGRSAGTAVRNGRCHQSPTGTTSRAGALTRRVTALAATTACCWT